MNQCTVTPDNFVECPKLNDNIAWAFIVTLGIFVLISYVIKRKEILEIWDLSEFSDPLFSWGITIPFRWLWLAFAVIGFISTLVALICLGNQGSLFELLAAINFFIGAFIWPWTLKASDFNHVRSFYERTSLLMTMVGLAVWAAATWTNTGEYRGMYRAAVFISFLYHVLVDGALYSRVTTRFNDNKSDAYTWVYTAWQAILLSAHFFTAYFIRLNTPVDFLDIDMKLNFNLWLRDENEKNCEVSVCVLGTGEADAGTLSLSMLVTMFSIISGIHHAVKYCLGPVNIPWLGTPGFPNIVRFVDYVLTAPMMIVVFFALFKLPADLTMLTGVGISMALIIIVGFACDLLAMGDQWIMARVLFGMASMAFVFLWLPAIAMMFIVTVGDANVTEPIPGYDVSEAPPELLGVWSWFISSFSLFAIAEFLFLWQYLRIEQAEFVFDYLSALSKLILSYLFYGALVSRKNVVFYVEEAGGTQPTDSIFYEMVGIGVGVSSIIGMLMFLSRKNAIYYW